MFVNREYRQRAQGDSMRSMQTAVAMVIETTVRAV